MSTGRRALAVLPVLVLVLAACSGGGSSSSSGSATSSAPSAPVSAPADGSPSRTEGSPQGSGSPGSEPTEQKVPFPADTSADGGPAQTGTTADPTGQMHVTGLRIGEHEGYSRLVVDLSTAGVPQWEVRYSTATGPGGGPVTIQGEAYLRVVLHTFAQYGIQGTSSVSGSGLILQAKTTGFFEGEEEVLAGVAAGPQPFRAFTLTDPGRIVIDVRRP